MGCCVARRYHLQVDRVVPAPLVDRRGVLGEACAQRPVDKCCRGKCAVLPAVPSQGGPKHPRALQQHKPRFSPLTPSLCKSGYTKEA
eukprot:4301628-Prymnesium_polylepis.1